MSLKKIVTSLELSEKLCKARFKCDNIFWWKGEFGKGWYVTDLDECFSRKIPAYTTTELMEWLSQYIGWNDLDFTCVDNGWNVYWHEYRGERSYNPTADTSQDALAKLVLWVLEQEEE